jgi:ribosomal protein S18 acetylase RimI-like enzyme
LVTLEPMNASDFPAFFGAASDSYARDNAASGRWTEHDAPSLAREETKRLLVLDEKTPDNYLFVLRASTVSAGVGYLWYGTNIRGASRVAFLFQLYIHEQYRRHGYGRHALLAFERHALNSGHDSFALNVFASNRGALRLYESAGYSPTSIGMRKLPTRGDA